MLNIVARNMWNAKEPRLETATTPPFQHVFAMNAPRDFCYNKAQCLSSIQRMQDFHISVQNQRDIRYNFLVGGDGSVYEGRGWHAVPMLPIRYSEYQESGILIGYIGEFTEYNLPSLMAKASEDLVNYGIEQGYICKNYEMHDIMQKPSYHRKEFTGEMNGERSDNYEYNRGNNYSHRPNYNRSYNFNNDYRGTPSYDNDDYQGQ